MSKGDTFENQLLLNIFNNSNIANIGDSTGVRGSTTAGSLYVSLHTADPGEAGTQSTSESAYTNYARVAVARASGASGWTVTNSTVNNASAVSFPACGATSSVVTYFAVGKSATGAGDLLYSGALTASLTITNGITPSFAASAMTITED
jgi:hypothetical protein